MRLEARIRREGDRLLGFLPLEDFSPSSRVYFPFLGEEGDLKKKIEEKKEAPLPDLLLFSHFFVFLFILMVVFLLPFMF